MPKASPKNSSAHLGFEAKLWFTADIHFRTRATLRDTLLPKVLSGELSVATASEEIEELALV